MLLTVQSAIDSATKSHNGKTVDWALVKRTVVASEPPRLQDVTAHIEFCQKWGGGASQRLILRTLEYATLEMPSDRIINGPFFKKN